jgi:1-pyrroline-5-carboxylate dehydrogenase
MAKGLAEIQLPANEPVYSYAPGTRERELLKRELERQANQVIDIPLIIGGREVRTGRKAKAVMPHDYTHVLAEYHMVGEAEVRQAIQAAAGLRAPMIKLAPY